MGQDANDVRREIEETRTRMGDTVEALGYKADVPSRVKDAVNDRVESVRGSIGGALDGVRQTIGNATAGISGGVTGAVGAVGDKIPDVDDARNAAQRGVGIATSNPLGLALGALAVGLLAGLMAPVTDYERKTIGPIRDDLIDRAKEAGTGAIAHGTQVLQETAQAALQTAQQSAQTHSAQVLADVRSSSETDE